MSAREMTADGILFDLDGTLIDSTSSVERSWRKFADRIGISFESMNGSFHGVPSSQTIQRLMAGRPQAEIDDGINWLNDVEADDVDGIVVLPGARELLDSLPDDRWAIVTSGNYRLASTRLAQVGLPIPRQLITFDDITHGKPSPEPYLKGAEKLGIRPDRCLVVEDAPAGVASGLAAGAAVLGLRTTHDDLGVPTVDDLSAVEITFDGARFTIRWDGDEASDR